MEQATAKNAPLLLVKANSCLRLIFILLAAGFIILAILGAINSYSSILRGDSWGTISFYKAVSQGKLAAFWEQHNEHRIVLTKILFWIDYTFFHGNLSFLIVINYIISAFSCVIFFLYCHEAEIKNSVLPFFIVCIFFSWAAFDNFTWEFQSQFFLAQTIPLYGFYFLYKSCDDPRSYNFILAVFLGVLNIGTMANGIFLLPLMTFYAWFARLDKSRVLLLALLSLCGMAAFWYHYKPSYLANPVENLLHKPVDVLLYFLTYLGGPFKFFSQASRRLFAMFGGGVFLVLFIFYALKNLRKPRNSLQLALLGFICYILLAAAITALGRTKGGVGQALTSRYMTPVFMGWGALLLLVNISIGKIKYKLTFLYNIVLLMYAFTIIPTQLAALQVPERAVRREVAGLSLSLGLNDEELVRVLTPQVGLVNQRRDDAKQLGFADCVTGRFNFLAQAAYHGESILMDGARQTQGALGAPQRIPGEEAWLRVSGWIDTDGGPPRSQSISSTKKVRSSAVV